jgi:hypothetical protein
MPAMPSTSTMGVDTRKPVFSIRNAYSTSKPKVPSTMRSSCFSGEVAGSLLAVASAWAGAASRRRAKPATVITIPSSSKA